MVIKVDLTQEPYFGIIRRWALRQRQTPRLQRTPDRGSPELHGLVEEIVNSVSREHTVTHADARRLKAEVHHTLVQLGLKHSQRNLDRKAGQEPRAKSREAQPAARNLRWRMPDVTRKKRRGVRPG